MKLGAYLLNSSVVICEPTRTGASGGGKLVFHHPVDFGVDEEGEIEGGISHSKSFNTNDTTAPVQNQNNAISPQNMNEMRVYVTSELEGPADASLRVPAVVYTLDAHHIAPPATTQPLATACTILQPIHIVITQRTNSVLVQQQNGLTKCHIGLLEVRKLESM